MDNYDIYRINANLKLLFNKMQTQVKTNIAGKQYTFIIFNDTFPGIIYNNQTYSLYPKLLVYSFDNTMVFGLDLYYDLYVGIKRQ